MDFYGRSLSDWLLYIEQLHHTAIDLGLSRVKQIAETLSLSNFDCPVITVAGTNGKGSCVACLESIYDTAGYQVATYTSPHLLQFNERIRLQSRMVDDATLIRAFEKIEATRQALSMTLSFFEFTTLAAFWIFQQAKPEVVLLEVGLGGRLDAVNIVDSDVAVITSISLDHEDWLGSTRESILAEKMGIARAHCPLVIGEENPPENLDALIQQYQVKAYKIGSEFSYQTFASALDLAPAAFLKPQNVAAALMTVACLQQILPVTDRQQQAAIANVTLPGRFEILNHKVPIILDVAHNPAAAGWLAQQLRVRFPTAKIVAVFGIMKDKDLQGTIRPLSSMVEAWYVTDLPVTRAQSALIIAEKCHTQTAKNCYTFASVSEALSAAIAEVSNRKSADIVVVFGSFYMVADAKQYLGTCTK